MSARNFDIAVVGGGLVGAALAYGMAGDGGGRRVVMLDEGDHALRAARGNFGLIWVQGKGADFPPYARWTLNSARRWPELARRLHDDTGIDVGLSQRGGLHLCLSEQERVARTKLVEATDSGESARVEMLDRATLRDLVPDLGPDVMAASYGRDDGHVNPLLLLRALHAGFARRGGTLAIDAGVRNIAHTGGMFTLTSGRTTVQAKRVVLAAGLGNAALAPQIGLAAPVTAQRGQIIALERMPPLLSLPIETLRQTTEGTVLLGDSHEDMASTATSTGVLSAIANRALRVLPRLAEARVVRCWAALRVLTSDGMPIYDASESAPGAFIATSHSGVTLAAVHALELAPQLAAGTIDPALFVFSAQRLRAAA